MSHDNSVLAITYDIWISGTKLTMTKKECIHSVDIKETVDGADTATIKIADPEFLYINDNIFLEDNPITINIGWTNTTYRVIFEGYISAIDLEFTSNGIPELTITCMDKTHIMNRAKKNETFSNCTNADVVRKIVTSYGYTCVIESGYQFTKQETITQSDQTDIDFIQKLASDEVYPFTARLVGKTFYYVKKGHLTNPTVELTYLKYPHSIISFSPKINKESKKVEISSSTVNTSSKSVSSTTGKADNSGTGSVASGTNSTSANTSKSGYTYDPATKQWNKS